MLTMFAQLNVFPGVGTKGADTPPKPAQELLRRAPDPVNYNIPVKDKTPADKFVLSIYIYNRFFIHYISI